MERLLAEKYVKDAIDSNTPYEMTSTFVSLGFNSLDFVQLCMDVEDKSGVEITSDMMYKIKTPNDLIELLITL